ncbi:P-loop containing nucleoside triphosphate hydrolase protein [Eremomyces bilateralis CBS 781.70]|uniref:Origin recognition complex subunit 1 n=1 Tax=Eremomyces bilateralis CBS 781.70 TaxID=1392243 RepID=A0A6G1GH45_9PEZI|nr:P-loop containing nucleoside triphosphate hydrolase protein [Eremomyces bilateralis CBS 781.70]KAF1817312.1 P-loop containing nucleoside triphosphate hydrolase protein [Eremomyces bilateralis CBS 781.70]
MAPKPKRSKIEKVKQFLQGGSVVREDSDDELGVEDYPWEWIYGESKDDDDKRDNPRKRKHSAIDDGPEIIGARMGQFECFVGDMVLLKAEGNEAWVGLICDLHYDEEEDEKMANFMWFSTPKEIRNKLKRRTDALENEIYLTPSWDDNPLSTINGKATVLSKSAYDKRYPTGKIPRNAKEYGKVFVCRRGCNTRTATYTEEFVWEDIYKGATDIGDLIHVIQSQTKATRTRGKGKAEHDLDEFVVDHDGDDHDPRTPKRRKKNTDLSTPGSRKKELTPRKLFTPGSKRIVIKRPLEFTPLGTRVLSPHVLSSPFQLARNQLHVSSVPASLPCREEEFAEVYTHLEKAITEGTGSCIYIAGTPGTGKTATVREVVAQLNASVLAEELDDFIFVEINGMKVTDPHQSYALLWEALRGDRVSPSHALELLEREFSSPSPRRVPCVVLMDELDQLVTKNQSVMYNFFNWPGLRHSRLIVLAVANTMDLPERTLSNKISSRLGLHRITFKGYTHDQLMQIVESRLANVPGKIVHPDAIQFASRKVAAVSGDARRALDICRRAVELAEAEQLARVQEDDSEAPDTPSKTGRKRGRETNGSAVGGSPLKKHTAAATKTAIVTIATIKQAISEATSSPLQQYLRSLPLAAKVFLAALLARIRRTGINEAVLGDVLDEARNLGLMNQVAPVDKYLLAEERFEPDDEGPNWKRGGRPRQLEKPDRNGKAARMHGIKYAANELLEAGIVGLEAKRGERVGRIRLGVGDEEIKLALHNDEEVRGFGF